MQRMPIPGDQLLVAIATAIPPLVIVAFLKPVAPVLRQTLPAVPFFAQVLFVLRRKILPALVIAQDSILLFR